MYDSWISERLKAQIADGKSYLQKLIREGKTDKARSLQDKIMFWQNDILPIILKNTCVAYSEVGLYTIKAFEMALKFNCNALLTYNHIQDDYLDKPRVGISNNKQLLMPATPTAMQIYCEKVEVLNMDGSGLHNVECYPILINELL